MNTKKLKVESNGAINVNASDLTSGVYVVQLEQNTNTFTAKLIVE